MSLKILSVVSILSALSASSAFADVFIQVAAGSDASELADQASQTCAVVNAPWPDFVVCTGWDVVKANNQWGQAAAITISQDHLYEAMGELKGGDLPPVSWTMGELKGGTTPPAFQPMGELKGGTTPPVSRTMGELKGGDLPPAFQPMGELKGGTTPPSAFVRR